MRLLKDPVPYVQAVPLSTNILVWHYVVTGPEKTPYEGGCYHGKLVFPREFPFKPPAIYMITPNGRFKVNQKLCLSISDFHPDTWNPAWSVSTILTGLLSFMVETTPTSGSIESNEATKRRLARESKELNVKDKTFCECFPDLTEKIENECKEKEKLFLAKNSNDSKKGSNSKQMETTNEGDQRNHYNNALNTNNNNNNNNNQTNSIAFNFLSNIFVMLGLALLAFVVKHVFNSSLN